VSINSITHGIDGDETALEAVIQDEAAQGMTEAGASDYLATNALHALIDSYIGHLRDTGIEQLKRRPRPKRRAAAAPSDALPTAYLRARHHGIEHHEIETLEQRLQRDREIIERRLLDMEGLEAVEIPGISKERARQISKRAIKTIGEIAGSDARFRVMADYRKAGMLRSPSATMQADAGGAPATPTPSVVILPDSVRPRSERPLGPDDDFDSAVLETTGAERIQSVLRH
jgi:RNA polymerase sigma-32 factor